MSGLDIQAKVKLGLARANLATGNGTNSIVLSVKTIAPGGSPINPPVVSYSYVTLVDAIVKSVDQKLIDNTFILATDEALVANGDVPLSVGDKLTVNGNGYVIITVKTSNPTNVILSYNAVIRSE